MSEATVTLTKCITKNIEGSWLSNGHLEVCLLKLKSPTDEEWQNDNSRTDNLAIIAQLLQPVGDSIKCLLEQEFSDKPSLVLAPELAFGSPDFESLEALVKQYPQNLILVCGFGFTRGDILTDIATREDVEGVWDSPLNTNKKYNGGWIWVKSGKSTKCYVFLKNYFEQGTEVTVPNLLSGDYILRLESSDLVIFPLICADLISKEDHSPCNRIIESLNSSSSSAKRVLITGSLLNYNSVSGHWKAAIGDLLEAAKVSNARLLLSNCINPPPLQNEDQDKWRCLSGAYQHREGCKPPESPLPYMRYVDDTKFSGLVIRNTKTGGVFGKLRWTSSSSEGRHAFSECSQYLWKDTKLQTCDGDCAADELYRFILRNKGKFLDSKIGLNQNAKAIAETELDKLLTELSPVSTSSLRRVAGILFRKCLKGIKKDDPFSADRLHDEENCLDCAITTLRLIQHAIGAKLMPDMPKGEELDYGQLLSSDKGYEILIWDSSEYTANQLYNMVRESVVRNGGSARPLTIVGRGNGGGSSPEEGRIKSNRLGDISNPSPVNSNIDGLADRDICEANDRVVFWKNQGQVDDILSSTDPNQNLVESLKRKIVFTEAG